MQTDDKNTEPELDWLDAPDESIEAAPKRRSDIMNAPGRDRNNALRELLKTFPQSIRCERHNRALAISFELNRDRWLEDVTIHGPKYELCQDCLAAEEKAKLDEQHLIMGIPPLLLGATLDQLTYDSENDRQNLEKVKQWAAKPVGFLLLLGGVGVGKSHIGAAILMQRRFGRFVTQSGLLRKKRMAAWDRHEENIVEDAKDTTLLVLDEVGVSGGGRDEYPIIHEIIDYRYHHFLPTVITSNLNSESFKAAIGERISDRIRQSAAAILHFCDSSKRPSMNSHYLEMAAAKNW